MDKANELLQHLRDRLTSPFFSSFLIAWLILNWKILVCFSLLTDNMFNHLGYETYYDCVEKNLSFWNSFGIPLINAVVYSVGYPWVKYGIRLANSWAFSKTSEKNLTLLGQGKIPVEQFVQLQEELDRS